MAEPAREPEPGAKRITAREFVKALIAAGIVREGEFVRRVVIDAEAGNAVRVYVERFGDERLLAVALALDGVEISGVPAPSKSRG